MAKLTNLTNLKRNFANFANFAMIVMQNFSALGNAEHITPIVQYDLDVMDEVMLDSIPRKGRKSVRLVGMSLALGMLCGIAPKSEQMGGYFTS